PRAFASGRHKVTMPGGTTSPSSRARTWILTVAVDVSLLLPLLFNMNAMNTDHDRWNGDYFAFPRGGSILLRQRSLGQLAAASAVLLLLLSPASAATFRFANSSNRISQWSDWPRASRDHRFETLRSHRHPQQSLLGQCRQRHYAAPPLRRRPDRKQPDVPKRGQRDRDLRHRPDDHPQQPGDLKFQCGHAFQRRRRGQRDRSQ